MIYNSSNALMSVSLVSPKKNFFDWWAAHQEKDRARRRAEQAAKLKRQVKLQALAKLTPEERKALGL